MTGCDEDRWASVDSPEAVEAAVERLRQMSNTTSDRQAREQWLELLAPKPGEHIVDVGAGIGDMAISIGDRIGPDGILYALDLSEGLLEYTSRRAREEGIFDRVTTIAGDARSLPFDDDVLDAAFSRWLLLHVEDAQAVATQMRRVVRPGGRIVCVEADWETLSVHPGDPQVTRRIVDANVQRQVDGRMGRKLLGLLRKTGLHNVDVLPVVTLDLDGQWLPLLHSRLAIAEAAGVPREVLTAWWDEVESSVESGEYLLSFTQYGVTGTVPGN